MKTQSRAPVIASALSGFVIGIIVTLIMTGAIASTTIHPTPQATLPPATPTADSQMRATITRLLVRVLGPSYPNAKQSRVLHLSLLPIGPGLISPVNPIRGRQSRYRSLAIVFLLNDHPLGRFWRLKEAKADVFAVLKALYTSQLPIYNVELIGEFPLPGPGGVKLRKALVAYMDYDTATTVPWKRWGREDEGHLWTILPYRSVNPRFA